jgi:hypothetical protein
MVALLKNRRNLIILALALSIIGAILVSTNPVGGMTVPCETSYNCREIGTWVWSRTDGVWIASLLDDAT